MNVYKSIKVVAVLWAIVTILVLLFVIATVAHSTTVSNIKYEVTEDRIVVSCVDKSSPTIRTIPKPAGGYYAVVVCEKEGSK